MIMSMSSKQNLMLTLLILFPSLDKIVAGNLGKPQNVVFIILDDFRPVIRAAGDRLAVTPNLDNLFKSSVYFENCFAQQSLCAPSRNSLLTSRRPDTLHLYDFYSYWRSFAGNFTTLPQYLKDHNYFTYSIGKVFHPGASSNFTDDYPWSWSAPTYHPPAERFLNAATCKSDRYSRKLVKNLNCPVRLKDQPGHTLADMQTTEMAIQFLKKIKSKFFLAVGFHKPHIPFQIPKKFLKFHPLKKFMNYEPGMSYKPYGMPNVAWNPYTDLRKRHDVKRLNVSAPFGPIPDMFAARIRQHYYAAVTYVDDLIGKMLRHIPKNTIVVLTSDHGWSLGEHAEWAKYNNFDVGLRVPLLIQLPKQKRSLVRNNIVELVDLFPTIVDLLELPSIPTCDRHNNRPPEMLCTEGRSLRPLLPFARRTRPYSVRSAQRKHPYRLRRRSVLHEYVFDTLDNNVVVLTAAGAAGNVSLLPADMEMAISQYPRPGSYPTLRPNSDRPKLAQINVMGYSIRLHRFRYTVWVHFDAATFAIDWQVVYGEELYDHCIDPHEKLNLVGRREFSHLKWELRHLLIARVER